MHFGVYLVRKGVITANQLVDAVECQLDYLVPIGRLAIEEEMLTMRQLFEVLRYQADIPHGRFGDAAIELGFLNKHDLAVLLMIQSDQRRPLAEILVEMGVLTSEDAQAELGAFRRACERNGKRSKPQNRTRQRLAAIAAVF